MMLFFFLFAFFVSVQCAPRNFSKAHHTSRTILDSISKDTNGPVVTRSRRCLEHTVRIPFVLSKNFSRKSRDLIYESLDDFKSQTCLWFDEVEYSMGEGITIGGGDFSLFFDFQKDPKIACYNIHEETDEASYRTLIVLNENLCFDDKHRIKQQIFGALGFIHENLRTDRDDYVTILWDNIEPGFEYNFRKVKENVKNWILPYDYRSISHHSSDYYSKDGKPTLISKDTKELLQRNIELSPLDLLKIDALYCPADETEITFHDYDIREQFVIFPLHIPYYDGDSKENVTTIEPDFGTETTTLITSIFGKDKYYHRK